ncbi:MAG: hypothetical protein K8I00_13015 [Candidatus Omnitrophica bacterium]|nr:hypothetical protein [Candidatus Omnitrophota bacterium]
MWLKWIPWRYILKQSAKQHNFLDPFEIFTQVGRFAQPADVVAPTELLRAGAVFHARGLINSQAIQHNLDWVWPYWVENQFDPRNPAFIPRAFSLTHVNLTFRNWTAVGLPDCIELPIVDPRGLVTPLWDGWSLDTWLVPDEGAALIPSRADAQNVDQQYRMDEGLAVKTDVTGENQRMGVLVSVIKNDQGNICRLHVTAESHARGWLAVSLRPHNPEGVSFVEHIQGANDKKSWMVNNKQAVHFRQPMERELFSYYRQGDVFDKILREDAAGQQPKVECHVGMASAAALWRLEPGMAREITVEVPLPRQKEAGTGNLSGVKAQTWEDALAPVCRLRMPDARIQYLYDTALRAVVLHSVQDIYPGPYTYKRFWFRDAVLILNAMLCVGLIDRSARMLDRFMHRQTLTGYFRSQEGEWDSNGQVLWIINRFFAMSGRPYDKKWQLAVERGAHWIKDKRLPKKGKYLHAGLLPAGFSAEHFGPNDYYYWDDFWSVAGLTAAQHYFEGLGDDRHAEYTREEAADLLDVIDRSLEKVRERLGHAAMPSSPYRRMDSGAIGSIVCSFPLQIWGPRDERVIASLDYLWDNCLIENGFFHDMSHSGINPYLTIHLAQCLLRAGDCRFMDLLRATARLASATGQWPEAIHPGTKGGCMGDGQHVWAAAEWITLIRSCFVREEGDRLILCSGLLPEWLVVGESLSFGPAQTLFGEISLTVDPGQEMIRVVWEGRWRGTPPVIEVRVPGSDEVILHGEETHAEIRRSG